MMASSLVSDLHELHMLGIAEAGVYLPMIMLIGDEHSSKCELLKSFGGLILSPGDEIRSNLPMFIRYEPHDGKQEIQIEKKDHSAISIEDSVSNSLMEAKSKCNENGVLHLVVRNQGIPNLLILDMPAIPSHTEEMKLKDLFTQLAQPHQTFIVNLISATGDFSASKSLQWARYVDPRGKRTLNVVSNQGEELGVTFSDLHMLIGEENFVFLKNKECQILEQQIKRFYPQFAKNFLEVRSLADKIMQLQSASILNYMPKISIKMDHYLLSESSTLPENSKISKLKDVFSDFLASLESALRERYVEHIRGSLKNLFKNILEEVRSSKSDFLVEELNALNSGDDAQNFLLNKKLKIVKKEVQVFVKEACMCFQSVAKTPMDEIQDMMCKHFVSVAKFSLAEIPNEKELANLIRDQVLKPFVEKVEQELTQNVKKSVVSEGMTWFTSDEESIASSKKQMNKNLESFIAAMKANATEFDPETIGHGIKEISHLQQVEEQKRNKALKVWMKLNWYLPIATLRVVDGVALELRRLVTKAVKEELMDEFCKRVIIDKDHITKWLSKNDQSNMNLLHTSRMKVEKLMQNLSYLVDAE